MRESPIMWVTKIRTLLFLFLVLLSSCSAANNSTASKDKLNILAIFGHLGKSHFDVFKPLLEELARRGHNITVASHFPRTDKAIAEEPLPTYKDIDLRDPNFQLFINIVDLHYIRDSFHRIFDEMYFLYHMGNVACNIGLRNPEINQLINSKEKFDLVLVESFNTNCFLGIASKFDAPFIQISTHQLMPWAVDDMGMSQESSYIPAMLTRLPRPMNLLQRTENAVLTFLFSTAYHTIFNWRDTSLMKEIYGPVTPDLHAISNNATMMFVNTHYTLHGAISFLPNVIEVGGIHISRKPKPVPKTIAKFLDDAHEGVLYFNLGSMVKTATMPEDKMRILLKVMGSIPRKVIWKWEVDDIPDLPSNIFVQKWLPQYDVLNHPNVKCYFGHGGLLGLTEGVWSGVPMILMPLYGDQYQNAIAAQDRGVAIVVKFTELREEILRHAINEIFNNTSYRENSKKLAKAFQDRPASPLETAVWWTEYVGRGNGVPYLRSQAANMAWYQRNLIDVALLLIVAFLALLYIAYRVINTILSLPVSTKKLGKMQNENSWKKTN